MDNFWSLLKRTLHGTYVSVEAFHLFRYVDEQAWRYNNREMDDVHRFVYGMRHVVARRGWVKSGWQNEQATGRSV